MRNNIPGSVCQMWSIQKGFVSLLLQVKLDKFLSTSTSQLVSVLSVGLAVTEGVEVMKALFSNLISSKQKPQCSSQTALNELC